MKFFPTDKLPEEVRAACTDGSPAVFTHKGDDDFVLLTNDDYLALVEDNYTTGAVLGSLVDDLEGKSTFYSLEEVFEEVEERLDAGLRSKAVLR
ncbi:MAG: hypothetical protein LBR73_08945 [Oscillospiraceae bacterium]|jgi:hypothetical protein|nr:hypothetical protein [Oscillospiraceae bacterium]